jgi:hypothetical protein
MASEHQQGFQAPGQSQSTSSQVGSLFRSQLIASSVAFFFQQETC